MLRQDSQGRHAAILASAREPHGDALVHVVPLPCFRVLLDQRNTRHQHLNDLHRLANRHHFAISAWPGDKGGPLRSKLAPHDTQGCGFTRWRQPTEVSLRSFRGLVRWVNPRRLLPSVVGMRFGEEGEFLSALHSVHVVRWEQCRSLALFRALLAAGVADLLARDLVKIPCDSNATDCTDHPLHCPSPIRGRE